MTAKPPDRKLQEKDFINESYASNPWPFWLWLVLLALLASLLWGGSSWVMQRLNVAIAESPFLQVTNRQFSLFLWQFPEFMRKHSPIKTGYLPGFQYEEKVTLYPGEAEKYVIAPPETLFLYHTWKRLIADEFVQRPIPLKEFQEFLSSAEEWQPKNWSEAPQQYALTVSKLDDPATPQNLATLPENALPISVRQAFQGWRNYYKEGKAINNVKPTFEEMDRFLQAYPHYARPNWRNILLDQFPDYLNQMPSESKEEMPEEQLAPFLRVAFYNYKNK